jgi:hypothetical protein
MAKKQTRRSISVSRSTYERLKAFCEANNVSMSQLVETRVNDFLVGEGTAETIRPVAPRSPVPSPSFSSSPSFSPTPSAGPIVGAPVRPSVPAPVKPPVEAKPATSAAPTATPVPMTSAAARIAIEPPPPIIKPKQETAAPKPAEKRPEQIFTF